MLNDAQQLALKFNEAFPQKSGGVTDQEIATACDVTKQAVNGWRSTGRIAKKHLAKLAELSHKPISFWLPNADVTGESSQSDLTQAEQKLINAYRQADERGRASLIWVAEQCLVKKTSSIAEQVVAIDPETLASSEEVRDKANAGRTV